MIPLKSIFFEIIFKKSRTYKIPFFLKMWITFQRINIECYNIYWQKCLGRVNCMQLYYNHFKLRMTQSTNKKHKECYEPDT